VTEPQQKTTASPDVLAAVDLWLSAPGGRGLVVGWLHDPDRMVRDVALEWRAGQDPDVARRWARFPRPDVKTRLETIPSFRNRGSLADGSPGFVCGIHVPEAAAHAGLALTLRLVDGRTLREPAPRRRIADTADWRRLFELLGPRNPEFLAILQQHAAPAMAAAARSAVSTVASATPIRLFGGRRRPAVDALVPLERMQDALALCAMLAGTADEEQLRLMFLIPRQLATGTVEQLQQTASFFGVDAIAFVTPTETTQAERLDCGLAAATADHVLLWRPCALPKTAGWLTNLLDKASLGLVSPTLIHEDGTVAHGQFPTANDCAAVGAEPVGAYRRRTAHVVLGDRALIKVAGGFSRGLMSDDLIVEDLAVRVAGLGGRAVRIPTTPFWLLEDPWRSPANSLQPILLDLDRTVAALRDGRSEIPSP